MTSSEERLAVLEDRSMRNERELVALRQEVRLLIEGAASGKGVAGFIAAVAPWLALVVAILALVWR